MSLAPKAIRKGASKRKAKGKDNCPPTKAIVTARDKSLKKPTPPKPSHGAGKGLTTTSGPVAQGSDRHLLTHKDYAIEMVESIIRDKDVYLCVEQGMEELGASGLFDLARVHFCLRFFHSLIFYCSMADGCSAL